MRTTKIILVLVMAVLLFSNISIAQNFVPNGNFESNTGIPTISGQLSAANFWQNPSASATPDYYYTQTGTPGILCDNVGVPFNVGGYTPDKNNGNGYAGISSDLNNRKREYISITLSQQLLKDTLYRVEFWVMRADSSRYASNRLGALFSVNPVFQNGTDPIPLIPQIETSNVVNDTALWTLITGIYQASGGENTMTIGIFRDDNSTSLQKIDGGPRSSGCTDFDFNAYYFIDDVLVRPANESIEILGDTVLCPGEGTTLFASTNVPFWWSDSNTPNDTISLASFISVNPTGPITYYLNGVTKLDSARISFVPAPVLNLGPDTLLCENDSIELDAFGIDIINYIWSTGDTTSSYFAADTGTYYVEVVNEGCSAVDTVVIADYLPNDLLSLGEDSSYCFFISDSLRLSGGVADSYLWLPTNETTPTIVVKYPATYTCIATKANGCISTASLDVEEICEPTVFAPTAFTPDGDGLNDVFYVYANNCITYNLRILNRRGQTVFYTEDSTQGWDGMYEGTEAPIGVYVYRVNYRGLDFEGIRVKKKILGTVTLFR
jgi:gliding motility-associated-like protein